MLAHTARNVLSKFPRQAFFFTGRLHAKQHQAARTVRTATTLSTPSPATGDDIDIIADFDIPHAAHKSSGLSYTGLFGHDFLTTPSAFIQLADSTLQRAELLTRRIHKSRDSREELFKVVKHLDRLSDLLCGVIDLAELVRNAHPDPVWVQSAEHVYEKMCEFMNVLNTDVDLYHVRLVIMYYMHNLPTARRSSELSCRTRRYRAPSDLKLARPLSSSGGTSRSQASIYPQSRGRSSSPCQRRFSILAGSFSTRPPALAHPLSSNRPS